MTACSHVLLLHLVELWGLMMNSPLTCFDVVLASTWKLTMNQTRIDLTLFKKKIWVSSGLESPVALFSTPLADLVLCRWILSTTGNFTCSIKWKSNILSHNRRYGCYRLRPLMTAVVFNPFKVPTWISLLYVL